MFIFYFSLDIFIYIIYFYDGSNDFYIYQDN